MSKPQTIRIASGSIDAPYSSIWRVVANGNEIYIGSSKRAMEVVKISLHSTGVWVVAATTQSGATFKGGNRRGKQWARPPEHFPGVTRGPSIVIPRTSLGVHKLNPDDTTKEIRWYRAPREGEVVDFSLYFVRPDFETSWGAGQILGILKLPSGDSVLIVASCYTGTAAFFAHVEKTIRESVVRYRNVDNFTGGEHLWITQSPDENKIPLLIDLPVLVGKQ